jgi:hypothetical protein
MYPRTNYEMTEQDLKTLLDSMQSAPMIMLNIGRHRSQQERANDAWAVLGQKMGFDHMTVQPTGRGDRFFTAIPSETELHKTERLAREAEEKRQKEITELSLNIEQMQKKLNELKGA